MIALRIEDLRECTRQLFTGNLFDRFLVREVKIVTFNTFTIDGTIRKDYFTEEELAAEKPEAYSPWEKLRPFCFSLIRGKKLPESFAIVFSLPPAGVTHFVKETAPGADGDLVSALYLNLRYEGKVLHAVTGVSISKFSVDRTIEHEWDDAMRNFLKKAGIAFTEE